MDFQVFVKPAGAACNLACRYCYYLEKAALHPSAGVPRMPADLLESYIVQHLEASDGPVTRFSWHGGEPTVLGLDYFREIVGLQRRHEPPGRRIANGIQTNGLLVDEAWARFFAAERFSVGLSLDGPADLHDPYRVTRGGEPTHARVMQALERLQRHRVAHDILCAVHDLNVRHPLRVYRFFRQAGVRTIGFLPVVEAASDEPGGVTTHTVPAEAYGEFLCAIFDEWVARDTARIEVQAFEEATRPARGLEHSLCILRETCGDIPVVEHTGDVYSCDHFVNERHRIGNLRESRLADLLVSPRQRAFGLAKRDTLPRQCRDVRRARPVPRRVPEGPVRADRGRGGRAQLPVPGVQAVLPARRAVRGAGCGRAAEAHAGRTRAGRSARRRTAQLARGRRLCARAEMTRARAAAGRSSSSAVRVTGDYRVGGSSCRRRSLWLTGASKPPAESSKDQEITFQTPPSVVQSCVRTDWAPDCLEQPDRYRVVRDRLAETVWERLGQCHIVSLHAVHRAGGGGGQTTYGEQRPVGARDGLRILGA